jgi:hypothetical protein
MTIQFKLGISLGLIACLLAMALLPTETQSTPARLGRLRHHHRATAQNGTSSSQHHQLPDQLQEAQDF